MTDMRATERLLEVVENANARSVNMMMAFPYGGAQMKAELFDVHKAITELRRRGDTLVRAADLDAAVEAAKAYASEYGPEGRGGDLRPVIDRLENALGPKP